MPRLAPVNVEDLLLRPTVKIDYARLESFQGPLDRGHRRRRFDRRRDLRPRDHSSARSGYIIENSEPATACGPGNAGDEVAAAGDQRTHCRRPRPLPLVPTHGRLLPDIVFRRCRACHVPLLEPNWEEGIKINVFGSVNVADAAAAAGAAAMVMISTDKAIELEWLGARRHQALRPKMYCQALDADLARRTQAGRRPMRLIAVRFGNVLASNGSVVPKFKAQIDAGGPVTVTHPDMVRYFMTIREACDLVVTAASHALASGRADVSVSVRNMGQPVKIVDLAERMIRLARASGPH